MNEPGLLFQYRLALALGMTRGEMLQRMTSAELAGWIAFDRLEPIGEERSDLRTGIVASTIANAHRTRGGRRFKPADFMPLRRRIPQTRSEQSAAIRRAASMLTGKAV